AHFLDRVVQALIKIDINVARPDSLPQLFSRNHLTCAFNQQRKHSKRLILQSDLDACLVQFTRLQVELKDAEVKNVGGRPGGLHGGGDGPACYRQENGRPRTARAGYPIAPRNCESET